jgi:S-DNA-T family DNA segregation ATPase FtsK/SpoIIIE
MPKNSVADKNRRSAGKQLTFSFSVKDERFPKLIGLLSLFISLYLFIAFSSYLFTWEEDQDKALWSMLFNSQYEMSNWLGRLGAIVSNSFFNHGFGIASYIFVLLSTYTGIYLVMGISLLKLLPLYRKGMVTLLWSSILAAFIFQRFPFPWGGAFGTFVVAGLNAMVGTAGIIVILIFTLMAVLVWNKNPDFNDWTKDSILESLHPKSILDSFLSFFKEWAAFTPSKQQTQIEGAEISKEDKSKKIKPVEKVETNNELTEKEGDAENNDPSDSKAEDTVKTLRPRNKENLGKDFVIIYPKDEDGEEQEKTEENKQLKLELKNPLSDDIDDDEGSIEKDKEEEHKDIMLKIVDVASDEYEGLKITEENEDHFEPYDPTLELPRYQNPPLDLLETYQNDKPMVDEAELEAKKDQIIETLMNYKIEIVDIKATVGPTVTLYEIIPAPGVRISKIKNLEDDIALSLAALGIRIIAPIPGKGTIGIEVPNKNKQIVSLREVLASPKFSNAKMDLPIVLGKTISNEVFVADLAKMPHLLIAGATGQGKSVGINTVIMSLLYKKHPSQIKLILIDPKKVELSPYNEIASHYLAFLPDEDEAIVTETSKVIQTLYSLTLEMDNRYNLLKKAGVRHITEYNEKFVSRKLNPENGHYFMPYMVLIIDEFADLIMTAGKEVEIPIGRLAQLARAIGIHLIIATQRPSVNIITGVIKANFPARLAFKVATKIDSRTILDAGGAEQLIGRGDMLLSSNGSLLRIQCAFVDTPEVHRVIEHIAHQPGYPVPYYLQSYGDEEGGEMGGNTGDKLNQVLQDMDEFFEDAARLVVINQSGSTSMIQRRLKLGYNRAGRIMDQLEYAGIVGANEGSKARQVLFQDEIELEDYLKILRDKKSKMTYK